MHTMTTRASGAPARSWRPVVAIAALVVVVAAAFLVVGNLVRGPDLVPRLTIRNETVDVVDVRVRGEGEGHLLPVAVVEPGRSEAVQDVIDQGDRWTFVLESPGRTTTTMALTREELEQSRWTVTIPASPPTNG